MTPPTDARAECELGRRGDDEPSRYEEAARGEGESPYPILGSVAVLVWTVAAILILVAIPRLVARLSV